MAKFRPGIPENFDIKIEPVSDLRDYLDEPSPMPARKPKPQGAEVGEGRSESAASPSHRPEAVAAPVSALSQPAPLSHDVERAMAPQLQPSAFGQLAVAVEAAPILLREERVIPQAPPHPTFSREPAVDEEFVTKSKAPRREISMTPEAFRMSEELLGVIRSGSGQRDTAAKELVHALILLAHEVIDDIDPHSIPKRGRWGTPTARAYPLELKNAFLRAVLRKHVAESSTSSVA